MNNGIKHVFFDLDHTLWDFDKNSGLTFKKIFELNNINIELGTFLKVYEPINLKYWKLYREERVSKPDLRYGRLKEAFDTLGVSVKDDMINHLSEAYIDYLTTFNHLFEGAIEILEYLQYKYHLHIITNGFEEAQERKMQNSKIRSYFKTVTNSEMVGVKKPNPKIFNYALNSAEANPNESIMIGDSLEADIAGAQKVGMRTIHFDYKDVHNGDGNVRVKQLKALINHL
ncbi:YjjG family noncanonical pyrimidine nucleotidase [Winogradskyella sp. KYW1333]|jgi:putative hydrolase of the HAD superfamily|uniref:YjjG family noncanonical pyrimidine nucleotidase n=1 Tax=Winogradskyella sp. KYW1333 TaxID=2282123 RepID=UPI000DF11535|nr:YjjG family noncanonical pyrimidine nucleotidase [Winogradskyella sp. KYW1333]RCT55877.1 noncanonical pyrimidine nucleotidase, YjjG family [Winogradskyella sp. KYW1333]